MQAWKDCRYHRRERCNAAMPAVHICSWMFCLKQINRQEAENKPAHPPAPAIICILQHISLSSSLRNFWFQVQYAGSCYFPGPAAAYPEPFDPALFLLYTLSGDRRVLSTRTPCLPYQPCFTSRQIVHPGYSYLKIIIKLLFKDRP